ncbi:SDR family NAD(P)-dependent oxidoreductase [Aestuariibacter salexigens]|uniref:SDR family NAD(P)-dependent oxidoreductase n=1 Tax=Aestuariibacter salexigens TaxID=226010 RepID=UPI00040BC7BE|nr:SDR family NAD(P)-dependent oxidoreductase [Aestuariibacter salexigens]
MAIRFDNRVAIVTGAGNGLGRSHALALAARGAKVVVNDLGGARDGSGASSDAAQSVVKEITDNGGEAIANGANVADFEQVEAMVEQTLDTWGRVDILINNAGILRDKSFAKMSIEDFRLVMDVHLMGAANCCKAVWQSMQDAQYGRILMTTSSSGMYGNFGQSNYGAAKMAQVGLMNTLAIEGAKYNIRVNALSPIAGTRMTEELIPEKYINLLTPESVTAAALLLCHEDAPNRAILCSGAGVYTQSSMYETDGVFLPEELRTPEQVQKHWQQIVDPTGHQALETGAKQTEKFITKAVVEAMPGVKKLAAKAALYFKK